jgi:hypothetical protein
MPLAQGEDMYQGPGRVTSPSPSPKIRRGDRKSLCTNVFVRSNRTIIFALGLKTIQALFRQQYAWKILPDSDFDVVVGATIPVEMPYQYKSYTEKYAGHTKLVKLPGPGPRTRQGNSAALLFLPLSLDARGRAAAVADKAVRVRDLVKNYLPAPVFIVQLSFWAEPQKPQLETKS